MIAPQSSQRDANALDALIEILARWAPASRSAKLRQDKRARLKMRGSISFVLGRLDSPRIN